MMPEFASPKANNCEHGVSLDDLCWECIIDGPWAAHNTSHHAHDYRITKPDGPMPFTKPQGRAFAKAISALPELLSAAHQLLINAMDLDECYKEKHVEEMYDDWNALYQSLKKAGVMI